jgi:hypothetical protein
LSVSIFLHLFIETPLPRIEGLLLLSPLPRGERARVRVNRRLVMGKTAEISINSIFPNPDQLRKKFDPAKNIFFYKNVWIIM